MQVKQNLLIAFIRQIQNLGVDHVLVWSQFTIVLLSLAVGYMASFYIKNRIKEGPSQQKILRTHILAQLVFPLTSFLIIVLINAILHTHYSALYLLDLGEALLLALVILRVFVRILEFTFATKQWAKQSKRWIVGAIWLLFALYVTGFSEPIISALKTIAFQYGKTNISLWDILQTITVVASTLIVALMLSYFIESRLLYAATADANLRTVLARFTTAFFVVLAFMIALPLVGIDLTVLSVFGGGLGLGIGVGLQKIASNYVSGFSLLLDRSIRIGDIVQIGSEKGKVQGLTARYIILDMDGTAALIPNDLLISGMVINKSYLGKNVWVTIPVQIAYTSDVTLAIKLMQKATEGIEQILLDPAPKVTLKTFNPTGVSIELGFWLANPADETGPLRSEINVRIWDSFKKYHIEFAPTYQDIGFASLAAAKHLGPSLQEKTQK